MTHTPPSRAPTMRLDPRLPSRGRGPEPGVIRSSRAGPEVPPSARFRHALEATRRRIDPEAATPREPDAPAPTPARRLRPAHAEPTPEPTELAPFRPQPSVLAPPLHAPALAPPAPAPPLPPSLLRLRVGRSREGELVQLRLRAPDGSELEVEVIASCRGVEVRAHDASPAWKARLSRTLAERGVAAEVV